MCILNLVFSQQYQTSALTITTPVACYDAILDFAPCFNTSVVAAIVPFCSFVDLYAGIRFHDFYCLICALFIIFITIPTHAHTSPAQLAKKRCL